MSEIASIKGELLRRVDALARELAPNGYRSGAYWIAANPWRDDRTPGSFWIAITGAPGAWRDEATGEKGDVLQLVQMARGLPGLREALAWSRDWLGGAGAAAPLRETVGPRPSDAGAEDEMTRKRRQAMAVYLKSRKLAIRGSLVEIYLKSRGIDLARLGKVPGALGFLPADRHQESGRTLPAMLAAMTGADGKLQAIHRTFLAPDGFGKADVVPARKIWPSFRGAAMRLWKGETGLSPEEAGRRELRDTLVLTEGVEDGLSAALGRPDWRVWAVGSLGNLGAIALPGCAARVVVCADNDWGKPQAERQFRAAIAALVRQSASREVYIARSPIGKDINDALMGG